MPNDKEGLWSRTVNAARERLGGKKAESTPPNTTGKSNIRTPSSLGQKDENNLFPDDYAPLTKNLAKLVSQKSSERLDPSVAGHGTITAGEEYEAITALKREDSNTSISSRSSSTRSISSSDSSRTTSPDYTPLPLERTQNVIDPRQTGGRKGGPAL